MNIGIDGGALSVSDDRLKVGVYRVIVNFLRELVVQRPTNKHRLYSFDPIDRDVLTALGDSMENKVIWPVKGWSTVRLPLELSLHPVDIFLGVSQMVPNHAGRAIGFIYDIGFMHRQESYPGSAKKLINQTQDLVKRSVRIVTISQTVKADILKHFPYPEHNITVAYPGVDFRFSPDGPKYTDTKPYFLFVGAMKPGKNVPAIIEAFVQFQKVTPRPHNLLLIGGDFWKDVEIQKTIEKYSLSQSVKLLGHVSDDLLPQYFRGAVAFVSPSHYEGFCLPAAEAMACGIPVIGSTRGAMGEIVGDGGILVNPDDVHALARALKEMSYNAKRRDNYAKEGIKNSKKFTWKQFATTVVSVMDTISAEK